MSCPVVPPHPYVPRFQPAELPQRQQTMPHCRPSSCLRRRFYPRRLLLFPQSALTFQFLVNELIKPAQPAAAFRSFVGFAFCTPCHFTQNIAWIDYILRQIACRFILKNMAADMTQKFLVVLLKSSRTTSLFACGPSPSTCGSNANPVALSACSFSRRALCVSKIFHRADWTCTISICGADFSPPHRTLR